MLVLYEESKPAFLVFCALVEKTLCVGEKGGLLVRYAEAIETDILSVYNAGRGVYFINTYIDFLCKEII